MAPGPLSARVAGLCQEVGHRLGGPTQGQVFDVRRRLSEPLRVAIAGRLKSGKSTLVNALIGRRVAPTEVGECTRIVTQFRYGTADRVDVDSVKPMRQARRADVKADSAACLPGGDGSDLLAALVDQRHRRATGRLLHSLATGENQQGNERKKGGVTHRLRPLPGSDLR